MAKQTGCGAVPREKAVRQDLPARAHPSLERSSPQEDRIAFGFEAEFDGIAVFEDRAFDH